MTISVGDIATAAFNGVAGAMSGVIKTLTISHDVNGSYDPATGTYATTPATDTGRIVVASTTPIADVFPAYVIGPADLLIMAEGLSTAPKEGWTATFDGTDHSIKQVLDIAGGGGAYYLVVV